MELIGVIEVALVTLICDGSWNWGNTIWNISIQLHGGW